MSANSECGAKVTACLRKFLASTGRAKLTFDGRTDLIRDLGLTSDEGVDFVLDLCDSFEFEFPSDFNPFVHDDGRRGRRLDEMVGVVERLLPVVEVAK
jgi:hypothetical protein